MPGPAPKPAALRQRRNKASTHAVLSTERPARQRAPRLPKEHDWSPLTRAWWRDVWGSPMAAEFLQADIHGLYILAELVDRFWAEPNKELAAEIRLQRQCFGLTPIDRRRLQWEVERGESAATRTQQRKVRRAQDGDIDPREALRAVK
mgnify:FL=1